MARSAAAAVLVVALSTGCGGSSSRAPVVFAASSLTDAFRALDPEATFNFGSSRTLAFQIEQGARADVFASASPRETTALRRKALVDRPRVFAANTLVVAVPRANPAGVDSWRDLSRKDVRVVLAAAGVPAGDYARQAFRRLGVTPATIASEEPDVRSVLTKLTLGAADAGVVYATDVRSTEGDVRALPIPQRAQPAIRYTVAIVRGAPHREQAVAFVDRLLGADGRAALRREGFTTP